MAHKTILAVIYCLILNNSVPLISVEWETADAFATALSTEVSVAGYFSATSLPMKIVSELMRAPDARIVTVKRAGKQDNGKSSRKKNRTSPAAQTSMEPLNKEFCKTSCVMAETFLPAHDFPDLSASPFSRSTSACGIPILLMILLRFLIMVCRDDLPSRRLTLKWTLQSSAGSRRLGFFSVS